MLDDKLYFVGILKQYILNIALKRENLFPKAVNQSV